jgi:hypothetical protein
MCRNLRRWQAGLGVALNGSIKSENIFQVLTTRPAGTTVNHAAGAVFVGLERLRSGASRRAAVLLLENDDEPGSDRRH